ncbi:MAG: Chaperone SurA [Syntrophus sp. SKADARSKE-3]|nr:Chaperone SurA [Syntrophus sp. SKADARSKE-3]
MAKRKLYWIIAAIILVILGTIPACNQSGGEPKKIQGIETLDVSKLPPVQDIIKPDADKAPLAVAQNAAPGAKTAPAMPAGVVAQVDDVKFTKGELDAELRKSLAALSGKIPTDRMKEATSTIRRQLVDDFVVRTLLTKEVNRLKITASDKEIAEALDELKKSLPSGMTMEEMMKKNGMTMEKTRQEVALGLRINKLVSMQPIDKTKPTDKDINNFYKNNPDKFKMPESVHARHILISKSNSDDEATKTKKRAKAEELRKKLLAGADFSELAKTNSECPSKANGGDLGRFTRGQMVKPFEDMAFKLKKNEISPVVETDFGYHIIQVIDHSPAKTQPLDKNLKAKIVAFLEQQKRYKAFSDLMNQLKSKANIVVSDKLD